MYCGKIVEKADVNTIFSNPKHPYTKGLLESIPSFDSTSGDAKGRLKTIEGMVPSLFELPSGCSFQDRCPNKSDDCTGTQGAPKLSPLVGSTHEVSCFNPMN
jgi:oligopeptide/dipeptide ABC transporter ATP-binding protein